VGQTAFLYRSFRFSRRAFRSAIVFFMDAMA